MNPIDNILLHNDEFTQSEIKIKNREELENLL